MQSVSFRCFRGQPVDVCSGWPSFRPLSRTQSSDTASVASGGLFPDPRPGEMIVVVIWRLLLQVWKFLDLI